MADRVRRRFWGGVLPLGGQASISGSSRSHCRSVSIAPPHPRGAKRLQSEPVQARTGPRIYKPERKQPYGPAIARCWRGETMSSSLDPEFSSEREANIARLIAATD